MPFDPQVLALVGDRTPDPASQFDPDVLAIAKQTGEAIERRRSYLRDKYAWGLVAPLSGTRESYSERAMKEITDPSERQWLTEEVGRVARAQSWAKEKKYAESGLAGRFGRRAQQVGGAFAEAGTAMTGAAADFRNWLQGRGRTVEEVQFKRQLEAAKQGEDPSLGKDTPLSLKAAAGAAGMTPDLSAGLLAGTVGGPGAMAAYWTARLFPERNEDYLEMGLSPGVAATAGAVTAAIESAVELLNIDPTGMSKGTVAQPIKGMARRTISQAIRKYGGKRLSKLVQRSPAVRVAIGQAIDALERVGVETAEEGIQRGVRDAGKYLAALTDEDIEGPVFSSIAPAMWEEMKEALPGIAALGGGPGMASMAGEVITARGEAKQAETEREILEYADQGKVPSRRTRKKWGLPEEGWESREQRQEGVRQLAEGIRANEEINKQARTLLETPPEVAQAAGSLGVEAGLAEEMPSQEPAPGAAEGAPVEPSSWGEPPSEEASARLEAQRAAEEARPKGEGFLAEETGAKPIGEKLGEPERPDVIGAGEEVATVGDEDIDRRLLAARTRKKVGFLKRAEEAVKTTWKYATRPQVHLPAEERFISAQETFRLLKAVPAMAVDEAIRTVASVLDPLGPIQTELFERALVVQNQLAALKKNQPLRFGFKSQEQVEQYKKKIDAQVEATPAVKRALEARGEIIKETVQRLVDCGLLPEGVLENTETYFHQSVNAIQEAKRRAAGGLGTAQRRKRSFQRKRVEGDELPEEFDYSTSYVTSESEWLADAFAELRKAELLDDLVKRYDRTADLKAIAKEEGITLEEAVRRVPRLEFWQPEPGNAFYRAFSIPEKIGERLQQGIIEEANLTADQVRQVVALGGQHRRVIFPTELVDQLEATKSVDQSHWLTQLHRKAVNNWKAFVLLNPARIVPYNVRNFTGDMDPVLAADPRVLKAMPQATTELWKYHHGRLQLSPELRLARDLGVVSAGFFSSEVAETSEMQIFRRLKPVEQRALLRNPARLYMEIVRPHVEMRENVLRYAAFLTYLEQVKSGKLTHYGASKRIVIQTLAKEMGPEVVAARLSRDLLGDYGNMTAGGEWIRRNLFPFWAFQEINLKRYPRLAINAIQAGEGRGRTGAVIATAAMTRVGGLYAALWTWNNLLYPMLFGRDDEDELGEYDQANPHILLGPNSDGTVRNFRNVGALGDFLEWFGVNEALSMWDEWKAGQAGNLDVAKEIAKAPIEKMIGLLRPDVKAGYEVVTGQSLFPNPFQPRSVERDVAVANVIGYGDAYKWMKGRIVGKGHRSRPHFWQRWFVGVVDPRQTAFGEIYDCRARFLEAKGSPEGGVYPISQYKQARDAAMAEDYDAFIEWKGAFQEKYPGLKGGEKFKAFLKRLDPIASRLSDKDEYEFEHEYLTAEQRGKLQVVRDYAGELRDRLFLWWTASEEDKAR